MSHPPHQRPGPMSLHDPQGVIPRTPTTPTTVEQYLRGGSGLEGSRWSPTVSPALGKDHDLEDDHGMHHRKSVLSKVKEKAKKWRNSLSKKKNNDGNNSTPSWGVSLEDDEEEADAEYLGAPMYESEMAPQELKETARQHPRAIPVISEKHVLPSSIKAEEDSATGKTPMPGKVATQPEAATQRSPTQRSPSKRSPKTITEAMTEKLAPAYASVYDATYAIASKIHSLTVSAAPEPSSAPATKVDLSIKDKPISPSSAPASVALQKNSPISVEPADRLAPVEAPIGSARSATGIASPREQMWDKGVSVKEYIMNKLEPGEDERALSQVISQAISPKKTPGGDMGVIEKFKGVVTSFLQNEESQPATNTTINENSASRATLSSPDHEVVEENQGRRLQTEGKRRFQEN